MPLSLVEPTYYAFFDESGDEGFNLSLPPNKRGKEWLIISAVLIAANDLPAIEQAYQTFFDTHIRQQGWRFHFSQAGHPRRLGFIKHMTQLPITCMSAIVHKPALHNREAFAKPYTMYFYTAKLVIERISWHVAKIINKNRQHGGVGLVFSSRRGGLTVQSAGKYLSSLQFWSDMEAVSGQEIAKNKIDWSVINLGHIRVRKNENVLGLQYADAVASSVGQAIELTEFNLTEHRYIKMLKPITHKSGQSYFSYGLKFFPVVPTYKPNSRFSWMRDFK